MLLVQRINESIEVHGDGKNLGQSSKVATIGVLDIFGFESLQSNSFERKSVCFIATHDMKRVNSKCASQSYASTTATKHSSSSSIVVSSKQSRPSINTNVLIGRTSNSLITKKLWTL